MLKNRAGTRPLTLFHREQDSRQRSYRIDVARPHTVTRQSLQNGAPQISSRNDRFVLLNGSILNSEAVVIEEKGRLWDANGYHFAYKAFLKIQRMKQLGK